MRGLALGGLALAVLALAALALGWRLAPRLWMVGSQPEWMAAPDASSRRPTAAMAAWLLVPVPYYQDGVVQCLWRSIVAREGQQRQLRQQQWWQMHPQMAQKKVGQQQTVAAVGRKTLAAAAGQPTVEAAGQLTAEVGRSGQAT